MRSLSHQPRMLSIGQGSARRLVDGVDICREWYDHGGKRVRQSGLKNTAVLMGFKTCGPAKVERMNST